MASPIGEQIQLDTKSGGLGCFGLVVIIAIIVFFGKWVWGKFEDSPQSAEAENDKNKIEKVAENAKEYVDKSVKRKAEHSTLKVAENELSAQSASDNKKKSKDASQTEALQSFEGVSLPFYLEATEKFNLLDASGKEMEIPIGSIIKVLERKPSGTLVTEINRSPFVGNESRVAGKVKLR
jgi:hypothetical protein